MKLIRNILKVCLVGVSMLGSTQIAAQSAYPNKAIKLIIPFGPGGVTDLTGRTFGKYISESLKEPVIVENKAGAGATIGANFVAKAAPDGYTMLLGTNVTHAINPQLMNAVPYDPLKDFVPIGMFGLNGNVLIVNASIPVNNFAEFIQYIKSKKGDVNYASGSIGSSAHLAAELLKQEVKGLNYMHVPYGGPSEAMAGLIGGHVDFMFSNIGGAVTQINAGKVKAIAVTTSQRVPQLPNVPTIAESGVPGFEVVGWLAAFVPKGTPTSIVSKLNAVINQAQNNPELRKTLDAASVIPVIYTPEQTAKFVQDEYDKWGRVIRDGNIPKI
jgi:tripartite-type tricarboxylate transporter receptor subunit TctC